MLIVKVFGGLGNQMFQYAFYKKLKSKHQDVYLDITDFTTHHHHQGMELEKVFCVDMNLATKKQIQAIAVESNNFIPRVCRKFLGLELRKRSELVGRSHSVLVDIDNITSDYYFDGYWQNTIYLHEIEQDLLQDFSFKNILSGKNEQLAHQIMRKESVFIHVRRGDYLKSMNFYNVCDLQYYQDAIQLLKEKLDTELEFFVFSDDIDWVRQALKLSGAVTYVDWNTGENSYLDMQIMTLCKHAIICNSTFSWWGAYLRQNKNGITIMPQTWAHNRSSSMLRIAGSISI